MSKRHPGRRRVAQEQENEDDIFVAKVLEAGNWAQKNQQLLTIGVVVLVVAILSFMYYGNYRESLIQQAGSQLEQIHNAVALQDQEGAKSELVLFLDRFGNTPYAGEARMLLGDLYLSTNDAQQALAVLEPMGASPREPLELQAAGLLGAAYEQERRWADAESTYLLVADRSELDFQVRDALSSAARIRASQGDADGAAELYQRILDDLDENDQMRGLFEMRLAELGVGT